MSHTAVYIRVSTKNQKSDSQLVEIKKWLHSHDMNSAQWFEDQESGSTLKRDALHPLAQF